MSVTFNSTRPRTRLGFAVSCYAYGNSNDWHGPASSTPEEAQAAHAVDHAGNPDCDGAINGTATISVYDTDGDPSVNVSNTNAVHLLELLGLRDDEGPLMCGSVPASDMRGRILLARALAPVDAGVPATVTHNDGGPTVYDGGRPVGYASKRFDDLDRVVDFAIDCGADISWG